MSNSIAVVAFLGVLAGVLAYSLYKFYKEKQYKVMVLFTLLGAVFAYYFKGLTEAKLATGGGIGVEGIFMAVTVMIVFLLDGIIAQNMTIYLKKSNHKGKKIAIATGSIFIIVSSLMMLIKMA